MNSTKLWFVFKKFRLAVFSIHAILSLGWTIFLSIFLSHEWIEYNISQRAIVLALTAFQGFSALLLYLMMVVRFRKWLDAARVAFILLFEASTVAIFSSLIVDFPCFQFGASFEQCKSAMMIIMISLWSQSGLLVVYVCVLALVTCFPQPEERRPDDARITPCEEAPSLSRHSSASSVNSRSGLLQSEFKRSVSSDPPQQPARRQVASASLPPMRMMPPARPPGLQILRSGPSSYTRGPRPEISSASSNSTSSFPSQASHAVETGDLSQSRSPRPLPTMSLPNPFADPLIRSPSAFSSTSYGSCVSEGPEHAARMRQEYESMVLTGNNVRTLEAQYRLGGSPKTPTPYYSQIAAYPPGDLYRIPASPYLQLPTYPYVVRMQASRQTPSRVLAATPGAHSVHSLSASVHSIDRHGAASLPPLPLTPIYSPGSLSPPPSALLPLPTGMRPFGDVHSNLLPTFRSSENQVRPPVSLRLTPVGVPIDEVDMQRWQKDVLGAARRA